MIQAVLIANRGEIACRIMQTCRHLGIRSVAVYSDVDSEARHVRLADEAVHIGPAPASESYLSIKAMIAAAQRAGADAIHPGFGFLAENGDFARACATAGLIFIGPAPAAIEAMGNKRAAKALLAQAGVPLLPGYSGPDQANAALRQEAEHIGFPLMVKAAAGGGGKGLRVVHTPEELEEALAATRREAGQAFGSDELILEQALIRPRHIEFQIFGDQQENVIHLGERECSIQRRQQKLIEETPSLALTPELRQKMGAAAVAIGRAIHYHSAGTVEFLLGEDGQFYFLEMNTRLQVEHPVTEMVTGIDLVEWQIRVAEGEPLPLSQAEVAMRGHAIEARLYAENPAGDFLPTTGQILLWRPPGEEGIRVESGIQSGDEIPIYYDAMLAKIIAHGPDRPTAIRRLARALQSTTLLGLTNNLAFLHDVLQHPAFQAGEVNTHFIAEHYAGWRQPAGDDCLALIAVTLAQWVRQPQGETRRAYGNFSYSNLGYGNFSYGNYSYWRNNPNRPPLYRYRLVRPGQADELLEVQLAPVPGRETSYQISLSSPPNTTYDVTLHEWSEQDLLLTVDGYRRRVTAVATQAVAGQCAWWVQSRTGVVTLYALSLLPEPQPTADIAGSLRAPMPGSVLAVLVEVGQPVSKGQALMKLEAMKMEHTIRTAADGVVTAIYFAPGDTVAADAQLLQIKET